MQGTTVSVFIGRGQVSQGTISRSTGRLQHIELYVSMECFAQYLVYIPLMRAPAPTHMQMHKELSTVLPSTLRRIAEKNVS